MATPNIVPRAFGEGGLGTAAKGWGEAFVTNKTTSSAVQGGKLVLASDDGAVQGDNHRLGVIEFQGAEDASNTLSIGASIESFADLAFTATENAGKLVFNTVNGTTVGKVLTLDKDKLATFAGAVTVAGSITSTAGVQSGAVALTATALGVAIPAGTAVANITSGAAARIVILPAPVIGNIINIIEDGTTGYELRSSTTASIGINGGTGSAAESEIAGAITYVKCVCVSATNWICNQYDADGDESKLTPAAN